MCVDVCKRGFLIQILAVLTVLVCNKCDPLPFTQLYPYNSTYGDNQTDNVDDGGSGEIVLTNAFPYFNEAFRTLYVNNNGILSFLKELSDYKPMKFPLEVRTPVIAPFWADVDTENVGGVVWYRQTTEDTVLLESVTQEIQDYVNENFFASWVFVVTWDNVGFYAANKEGNLKRNTFQCVLVTDGILSYAIFNYHKIVWTTGANSGGNSSTGLGGTAAQAGFNAGDLVNYYSIEGAQTPEIINLPNTSNVGIMGKWVFRVDSAVIEDIDCDLQDQIIVHPRWVSMMGGKELHISGLCFSDKWVVKGRIKETDTEFPCNVINQRTVGCVVPPMFKTGDVTLEINLNDQGWNYSTLFTSLNVASVENDVVREQVSDWLIGRSVRVTWDTQLIPSNETRLEVIGFKHTSNVPIMETVQSELVPGNLESGAMELTLDTKLGNYSAAIIKIVGKNRNILPSIWSDVFPVRWDNEQKSKEWCEKWMVNDMTLIPLNNAMSSCPCTLRQAIRDTSRYHPDPLCKRGSSQATNCQFHSQAQQCMRRNIRRPDDSGEQCCYDHDGELLNALDRTGGGTHHRYHYRAQGQNIKPFFSNFFEDLLPYIHCCQEADLCEGYLELRPSSSCQQYHPPIPAQAAGDPHLVTLDGLEYTFNGIGDYTLVEDKNSTVVVQVRSVPTEDSNGITQNASVFSAIALAVRNQSDVVEIRLTAEHQAEVLVNNLVYEIDTATSELTGVTIYKEESNATLVSFLVVLEAAGISVSVDVTIDLLNILVMIGSDSLQGQLQGLLGNYNGDKQDDFRMKSGQFLATDAPMSHIHFQFGQSWQVKEAESLFSDTRQDDPEILSYSPVFLDSLSEEKLPNGTSDLCGDNKQCIFDFLVTRKESVARSTMQFVEKFQVLKEDIKPVIRCPHLTVPENGNRTVVSYAVGSEATFQCLEGYTMVRGTPFQVCTGQGEWDGEPVVCAKKVPESKPNVLIISLAAGSGFLVFIVIATLFYVCYSRYSRRKPENSEDNESPLELPDIFCVPSDIPKPVFENPVFLMNLQRLNEGGGFHIPRPHYLDPLVIRDYF